MILSLFDILIFWPLIPVSLPLLPTNNFLSKFLFNLSRFFFSSKFVRLFLHFSPSCLPSATRFLLYFFLSLSIAPNPPRRPLSKGNNSTNFFLLFFFSGLFLLVLVFVFLQQTNVRKIYREKREIWKRAEYCYFFC